MVDCATVPAEKTGGGVSLRHLQVPHQALQQGPAAVVQHCRGQAVACDLAFEPQAVPGAPQGVNLCHVGQCCQTVCHGPLSGGHIVRQVYPQRHVQFHV